MAKSDQRTKDAVVQGILNGAGGKDPEGVQTLRTVASFLFNGGAFCATLGAAFLGSGWLGMMLGSGGGLSQSSGLSIVQWGGSLLSWGLTLFATGILLRGLVVLLSIDECLREVRDHLRKL